MNIKKVDDKPMVIHTKEKAKIHSHEPKTASIKGSNIYTVDRNPKIKQAAVAKRSSNGSKVSDYAKGKSRQTYRRSTKHGTEKIRENGISRFRRTAKKAATETAKTAAKETAKETAKTAAKKTAKTAATAAAGTAGTAVAPGVETAIGIAAGYASGVAIEAKDTQISNRNQKIKFFLDKMKAEENQQDSIVKLAKDLITRRAIK